jgi:carboxymethylenebutenolidase
VCDDHIHQGLTQDPNVSRRTFGLTVAAAATLSAAAANAQGVIERDVDIKTPDGVADSALYYPAGKGRWPAVVIWTDILGLRPVFRDMGRRLASQGYVVLVPNPFYRKAHAPVVDGAFDFNKPEDRAKVMPLAATITPEGTQKDAVALIAFLDSLPQTDTRAKVGTQGYCMGGPLVFRTAAAVPGRVGAVGSFHGGGLVTDKPDSPHLLIPQLKAQVYCGVADNDDMREPKSKDVLRASFDAVHVPGKVEVYTGANHGWCVKGSAVYVEAAAERAWAELTTLYKKALV